VIGVTILERLQYRLLWIEMWFGTNIGKDHLGYQFFWFRFTPEKMVRNEFQLVDECRTHLVWKIGTWFFTIIGPDA
jgi:hypothetical protein